MSDATPPGEDSSPQTPTTSNAAAPEGESAPPAQTAESAASDAAEAESPAEAPSAEGKGEPSREESPPHGAEAPGGDKGSKPAPKKPKPSPPCVVVRYGAMRSVAAFRRGRRDVPPPGGKVVVRTDRGVELGQVLALVSDDDEAALLTPERYQAYVAASGSSNPNRRMGKVLRPANEQDLIDHRHLEGSAREAAAFCREQIRELKLPMKLIAAEHLLGGERIVLYFSAETRVDFRKLVQRLASRYHTRIEMRQVGARDEARLVADYERCGQRCCYQKFLKDLKPVSMRMAKVQKATLDPAKISGRCGRLMCCLRYEDEGYEHLRKLLPKKNTWVRAGEIVGRVVDTHILTQLVALALPDGRKAAVPNEAIEERDLPAPKIPEPSEARPRRERPERRAPRPQREAVKAEAPAAETPAAAGPAETDPRDQSGKKRPSRRKRRGRKKKGGSKGGKPQGAGQAQGGGQPQGGASSTGASPKKKRRRRRRKKKPGGGGSSAQS